MKPEDANARYLSEAYQKIVDKANDGFGGLSQLMDTITIAGIEGVFVNEQAIRNFWQQ